MLNKKAMFNLPQYNFGTETNDAPVIFEQFLDKRKDKISYWQIVHLKSAAHEGFLAYKILFEREKESLSIHARNFFSVYSPLERFFPRHFLYNKPIFNHQNYLDHYRDLLEIFETVCQKLSAGSSEYFAVGKTCDLLRLQLYGFGRAALQQEAVNLAILAFKLANVLNKKTVHNLLINYWPWQENNRYLKL